MERSDLDRLARKSASAAANVMRLFIESGPIVLTIVQSNSIAPTTV